MKSKYFFLLFQVVAGILFLVIGGLSINDGSPNQKTADILNDVIVVVIFIITLINVVISGFGIMKMIQKKVN